ncbi:hypothetical protein CHARACLAT_022531, partial [Characodon lateralis]|nr:hypothetical protein [Characodon lateralis]
EDLFKVKSSVFNDQPQDLQTDTFHSEDPFKTDPFKGDPFENDPFGKPRSSSTGIGDLSRVYPTFRPMTAEGSSK